MESGGEESLTFQGRKIIHIDMDAFYASVEQRDNKALRGRPVVVGGSPEKRGVVAAASYESRKFGIHSAMPMSRAVKLCPDLVIVKTRISYYSEISRQIMGIYRRYTDLIEPISLDECFLDVTENRKNIPYATDIARDLKRSIKRELDLTASAGVAPNKFLAKIASDMNKPDGLTVVKPHMILNFLSRLSVSKIWGVGRVTFEKMQKLGINTIGDLAEIPEDFLIDKFGKAGFHFYKLARGQDDRLVQPFQRRKSVSQETTFANDTRDIKQLAEVISSLGEKVCKTLESKGMMGSTVTLKLRYADFTTITRSRTMPYPFDRKSKLVEEGVKLLGKTQAGRIPVRLIGIGLSNLLEMKEMKQLMLFDPMSYGS